jgi:putative ABC transport system substrate-binding protein
MRRRDLLACALTLAAPAIAHAQQNRSRRIALILPHPEGDTEGLQRVSALRQSLRDQGWAEGQNLIVDLRWLGSDPQRAKATVKEVIERAPDLIVVNGSPALAMVREATESIPVIFVVVLDPVGAGFVKALSRPGGNITGFGTFEPEIGGKWVEALKELAPHVRRIGVLTNPGASLGLVRLLQAVESVAARFELQAIPLSGRDGAEIASEIDRFAGQPDGGLIILPTPTNVIEREVVYALAIKHRLPAIYPFAFLARNGGLLAYGFEPNDLFRRAGPYVARILNGEKPGDLPVQAPVKFELVVNLRAAHGIGLAVPPALLARADEVIE